jgi:FkbM family methyltransferase
MRMSFAKRLSRTWRGRLRARLLGQHGFAVLCQTKNGTLAVDPRDFTISRQLLLNGEYGTDEMQFIAGILPPGATMIFVGAHIGSVLIPLAKHCDARNVMAFEPSPKTFRLLDANLRLNGLDHVERHQYAIACGDGDLSFIENPINTGNSRICLNGNGTTRVRAVSLDATVPTSWEHIDLMVIDVEGFECDVLRGAADTLQRTKHCLIEFAPEQLQEQGETVESFAQLCAEHFTSGYAFGRDGCARIENDLGAWIPRYPRKRGLLLNLLLMRG